MPFVVFPSHSRLGGHEKARFESALIYASFTFAESPILLVRLYDKPSVPAAILVNAEKETAALLESCSIKVSWKDCSKTGVCDHDLAPNELIFHLRPPSSDSRRPGDRSTILGTAEIGANGVGVSAWVNYHVIQIVAARENISLHMLLAYVFTHEIAHLLGAVHEPASVMHDRWGSLELRRLERVYLKLDKKERDHMRAEAQARMHPHGNNIAHSQTFAQSNPCIHFIFRTATVSKRRRICVLQNRARRKRIAHLPPPSYYRFAPSRNPPKNTPSKIAFSRSESPSRIVTNL